MTLRSFSALASAKAMDNGTRELHECQDCFNRQREPGEPGWISVVVDGIDQWVCPACWGRREQPCEPETSIPTAGVPAQSVSPATGIEEGTTRLLEGCPKCGASLFGSDESGPEWTVTCPKCGWKARRRKVGLSSRSSDGVVAGVSNGILWWIVSGFIAWIPAHIVLWESKSFMGAVLVFGVVHTLVRNLPSQAIKALVRVAVALFATLFLAFISAGSGNTLANYGTKLHPVALAIAQLFWILALLAGVIAFSFTSFSRVAAIRIATWSCAGSGAGILLAAFLADRVRASDHVAYGYLSVCCVVLGLTGMFLGSRARADEST